MLRAAPTASVPAPTIIVDSCVRRGRDFSEGGRDEERIAWGMERGVRWDLLRLWDAAVATHWE